MANNKQISMAVIAVVLATALFSSVVASSDVFAKRGHGHHHGNDNSKHASVSQAITQVNSADQSSSITTAGAFSSVDRSGNNVAVQGNFNFGGNAANVDQSD